MAIFGHSRVIVEKDPGNARWIVRTLAGAELLVVAWADAFKSFPHHPDYQEAILTCQSDDDVCLTDAETKAILSPAQAPDEPPEKTNVLRVDFKRKKRV